MFKRAISAFAIICLLSGSIAASPLAADAVTTSSKATEFSDLESSWAKDDIVYIAKKGIINGVEQNGSLLILPEKPITRAELSKILITAKGIPVDTTAKSTFADIESNYWAKEYIEAARAKGITKGYEDNTFRPEQFVNRAEMASMIVRTFGLTSEGKDSVTFEDIDSKDWFAADVKAAAANKLIVGIEKDGKRYFEPNKETLRAEAFAVVARYLKAQEALPQKSPTPTPATTPTPTPVTVGSSGGSGSSSDGDSSPTNASLDTAKINALAGAFSGSVVKPAAVSLSGFTGNVNSVAITPAGQETVTGSTSRTLPGLTGSVIDFTAPGCSFSSATLSFDVSSVDASKINNLAAAYCNETTKLLEFLPTTIDAANKTVSFTTTHNSKYVLIDKSAWIDFWRSSVTQQVYDKYEHIDFAFIIDSSGSMSSNDPQGLRKQAVTDVVYGFKKDTTSPIVSETVTVNERKTIKKTVTTSVYDSVYGTKPYTYETTQIVYEPRTVINQVYSKNDRAAVIDFESTARILSTFTAHQKTVSDAVYYVGDYGTTNIYDGIRKAINVFDTSGSASNRKIAILLTDGQHNTGNDTAAVDEAKKKGIAIMTIGLSNAVDDEFLKVISSKTGGSYFKLTTASEIITQFKAIQQYTVLGQDTDGDGITDYDELRGVFVGYGVTITTDPNKADTDGDGVSDSAEFGVLTEVPIENVLPAGSVPADLVGKKVKMTSKLVSFPDDANSK